MKKTLLFFILIFSSSILFSQVSIIESFDAGTPSGWTDSYANTTSETCAGNSERDNLYSSSTTGNMTSPNQVAASNGTDITFSIDYKVVDWSAATNPTADGWGSADLQYSTDNGATWTTAITLDDSNDSNSNVCMTIGTTIPGASVPAGSDLRFQVANTWAAGDYYFYVDNFVATQVAANPPNCDATLTSALTDFPIDGSITWTPATGGPTGYKISVGSTSGGTDIANSVDVMAATSYTPAVALTYSTTYFVTIVPYNANGDATGCSEESFITEADPAALVTVNCGTPSTESFCYDNNEDNTWLYSSSDGTSVMKITFTAGQMEGCCDDIIIYDGSDNTGTVLFSGNNGGNLAGLEFTSTGPNMFVAFVSDGSVSCVTNSYTPADWSVECLSCSPGAGSVSSGSCDDANGYMLDVDVTNLGDGTIVIKNDGGVADVTVTSTGVTSIGPFTFSSTVVVTLAHPTDMTCDVVLPGITLGAACPPANDDCAGAISVMVNTDLNCTNVASGTIAAATPSPEDPTACGGTEDDDVWFSFVATATDHPIEILNITGGTSDLYHSLWSGTCGNLVHQGLCSDPNTSTATGLTIGDTYYLRVYSWTSTSGQTSSFDVCIKTPPPPPPEDNCVGALTIPVTPNICAGFTTGNNASSTDSNNDVPAPPAATCSNNYAGGDIWFKLTVPASGNVTISGGPSPDCCSFLWYEVYTGADCGTLASLMCSSTTGNDPSAFEMELTGQTPGATLWIRAWDSSNDDGPGDFNFCAKEPVCEPPVFTLAEGSNNCPVEEFMVNVDLTSLGSAAGVTIKNDGGVADVNATIPGMYMVGPFPSETTVEITVEDVADATCSATSTISFGSCPPECASSPMITCGTTYNTGDLSGTGAWSPDDATSGACYSTPGKEKVWQFVPESSGMYELVVTLSSGTGSWNDYFWRGDGVCEEANWTCIDDISSGATNTFGPLTAGTTYYLLVDSETTGAGRIHDFVITCLDAANDDCVDATDILDSGTTGSGALPDQSFDGATASGMGAEVCDGDATSTPADLWYRITTLNSGMLVVNVVPGGATSDVVMSLYNACGDPVANAEACADNSGPGAMESINVTAALQNSKTESSSRADEFFLRVYEKSYTGETFTVETQGSALPIELSSFTAKANKRGNLVEWTTESEINTDYTEVQASPNGTSKWEVIGKVKSEGNTIERNQYEMIDNNPYSTTYYRLNTLDLDGTIEKSDIISVSRGEGSSKMVISPNPTNGALTIQTTSSEDETGTLRVLDLTGKLMQENTVNLIDGLNTINITIDDLPSGVYLLSMTSSNGIDVQKIVKN